MDALFNAQFARDGFVGACAAEAALQRINPRRLSAVSALEEQSKQGQQHRVPVVVHELELPQRDNILEEEWEEEEKEEQQDKEKEAEQQRLQELMRLCMDCRDCKWTMRREQ